METNKLSTLAIYHLAQKMPHKQTTIRAEMRTIREHLRIADAEMKLHNWQSVAELMNEIAAMATHLMVQAEENQEMKGY